MHDSANDKHNVADSAGQPWAGRHFEPNPSAGDDGSAPAALIEALESFRRGDATVTSVVEAFRGSRLLIPLLAELGDFGVTPEGRKVDKSQELSIVTVAAPDGRTALPVFSSVATMSAWNPLARPVPATGPRVALAAASEGTDLVILDPASVTEFAIRRPALWALAQERDWLPSFLDPEVASEFGRLAAAEDAVVSLVLVPGDPDARVRGPELRLGLVLADGLSHESLAAILERLSARFAESDIIAERVDSLDVVILPAT